MIKSQIILAAYQTSCNPWVVERSVLYSRQQFSRESRITLSLVRTDRFGPTLSDAVAETQSAVVT
jgi:hypothetical protein